MTLADRSSLLALYAIPYWATQILTWLLLPAFQMYNDAGDFTVRERIRTSLKENAMFYAVLGGLGLVVVLALLATKVRSCGGRKFPTYIKQGVTLGGIASGGVAFSLSFSIATGVLLMGYGLAQLPRICWQRSRLTWRQQLCEHQVGSLSERLEGAHTELSKVVWMVDAMSNTMPRRHHLRWAMDVIDDAVKHSAVAAVTPDEADRDNEEYDYEDLHALASLRRRLNRALNSFDRVKHEYVQAVTEAMEVADIVACREVGRTGGEKAFRSSLRPPRTGSSAKLKDAAEYWWKCVSRRYLLRCFAVVLAFTSCVLVLAEATIWLGHVPALKNQDLSIVSLMIESAHGADLTTKALVGTFFRRNP